MVVEYEELTDAIQDRQGFLRLQDVIILPAGHDAGITLSTIKIVRWVAAGSFGSCYHGITRNGTHVAIKTLVCRKSRHTISSYRVANREIQAAESPRLMDLSECPNVVKMLAHGTLARLRNVSKEFTKQMDIGPVLIFEWCNAGDIDTLTNNLTRARVFIPEGCIWSWLLQLLGVANRLTQPFKVDGRPIVEMLHDDIKPDNIFLTFPKDDPHGIRSWPIIKVGDFGLCKALISETGYIRSWSGVPPHCSPQNPVKSIKSELWEFVHVIYMVCTIYAPARPRDFDHLNPQNDPFLMNSKYSDQIMQDRRAGVKAFFEYCLVEDVRKRPTPQEALKILKEVDAEGRAAKFEKLPYGLGFVTFADFHARNGGHTKA